MSTTKTFLEDGLSTDEIRQTVSSIRKTIASSGASDKVVDKIKNDYPFFLERYPMLFDMVVREDFNQQYLDYFLNMRENVINDKVTTDEASKEIGQIWFNKFVDTSKMTKKDKK